MRDNGLHPVQVFVCRRFGIGQNKLAVEDVQPLIFHRAHIEVADRDDLEQIKVIFEPVDIFIPFH
ncbi:MAG: Uncharacterised protein [SAR116 cluster bacterium]|nr:MAG: Uncharacterised protein [SAR116 cluster bacterium]